MKRLLVLGGTVAALIALGPAAHARPFTAHEQTYLVFASHYWGAVACDGHPQFSSATDAQLQAAWAQEGDPLGLAWPDSCRAWIDEWALVAGESWACTLVVHEYGHLLRHDDGESRMPEANVVIRPCLYGFGYRPCATLSRRVRLHRRGSKHKLRSCRHNLRRYQRWTTS